MDGALRVEATLDDQPAGLGFLPDGTPLVVSLIDRLLLSIRPDGQPAPYADLRALTVGGANDMLVDTQGRAFIGSFGYDLFGGETPRDANLVRVDCDRTVTVVAEGLVFPNGMVITPGERTLIVAESHAQRLTAFDLQSDGTLSGRRTFAALGDDPDGICRDAEGAIWVAYPRGKRFVRVLEGGEITDVVEVPGRRAVACELGGPDGRTLFSITVKYWRDDNGEVLGESKVEMARVPVPTS
jgi:sugar lactone lactonase YvrE